MTYYIYHIPGKKIGVTCDLYNRVTEQQGYEPYEFEILTESEDIDFASDMERQLQKEYGYKVDETPYNELKFNNKEMNINITEQTTTFPCPINKLKGQLMDNLGMSWETDHGDCIITKESIKWIMKNIQISRYNEQRSYVYNKAFARYFDNHDVHDQYGGKTLAGAMSDRAYEKTLDKADLPEMSQFDLIREWANERGLYEKGDPKTQYVKLIEEAGEVGRAILKNDKPEIVDGIGDMVVVLTNLAELTGTPIEECIQAAYDVISKRTGKMKNGTFVKDTL